eukprot:863990-Rhodomonas_salina.1
MGQRISPGELEAMVNLADESGTGEIDFENFCARLLARPHPLLMTARLHMHIPSGIACQKASLRARASRLCC